MAINDNKMLCSVGTNKQSVYSPIKVPNVAGGTAAQVSLILDRKAGTSRAQVSDGGPHKLQSGRCGVADTTVQADWIT